MRFKVVVMAGIFSLLTCFLTFPCFASELSTSSEEAQDKIKYNSKDLTMASEIGLLCTNNLIAVSLKAKNADLYSTEKIRECVKEYFEKAGWKYDL
jgi:dGTP triphosphohydrolase